MNTELLIGKTEKEAKQLIEQSGFHCRITKRDDYYFVCTMDFNLRRINLKIENDIVVSANIG